MLYMVENLGIPGIFMSSHLVAIACSVLTSPTFAPTCVLLQQSYHVFVPKLPNWHLLGNRLCCIYGQTMSGGICAGLALQA